MNNIPAQAVAARAAAGGAISTHSRHRCTCVLPLPPNSAPLSSTRAHPIICSQADCGVCCANADPPDAGQSMIVMPLSGPGGRSTAREAASLPFATLATTAELHAVQSSSGGEGLRPAAGRMVNSCLLTSSAPSAASPRAPAASPSNRFCVLLCPVLAMSLCREGHRRRRRSGGPFVTETTKTFHPSGCCCRQKNQFGCAQGLLVI